jgi:hypothetical protein
VGHPFAEQFVVVERPLESRPRHPPPVRAHLPKRCPRKG